MAKKKFYVVWRGRRTGVFSNWDDAKAQVTGFPGAEYMGFETLAAARAAFRASYEDYRTPRPVQASLAELATVGAPILESYAVDAACTGNPGPLEYRCVLTSSGEEIFRRGPFRNGTNNIGEFLAIVEALELCQQQRLMWPIYSDSRNAIKWVLERKCQTHLAPDASNRQLFKLIRAAESWLSAHTYSNPIMKWETEAWGEIPADYGRK